MASRVRRPVRFVDPAYYRPLRRGVCSRIRGDESGNALVLAIAAVLLTGLLMGIVFSSVMFSVGHTTATRAAAASRAEIGRAHV